MAYFPDFSPYAYGRALHAGVVHVGWLDRHHDYPRGKAPSHLIEKMKEMATRPKELCLGHYLCDLCAVPRELAAAKCGRWLWKERGGALWEWEQRQEELGRWEQDRSGNGEIRVSRGGITYAAPALIVHYIEEHGYLPPEDFLRAVEGGTDQAQ